MVGQENAAENVSSFVSECPNMNAMENQTDRITLIIVMFFSNLKYFCKQAHLIFDFIFGKLECQVFHTFC